MKTLYSGSVLFFFLFAGCSRNQSVGEVQQELVRTRAEVERLTERIAKLENQRQPGSRDKEVAEIDLRITALKAESEVMDKQMAEVIKILKEWAHTHHDEFERAAKVDVPLALKLVAASGKLADARLKDLTKAREKYRAEAERIWNEYQRRKKE